MMCRALVAEYGGGGNVGEPWLAMQVERTCEDMSVQHKSDEVEKILMRVCRQGEM